MFPQKFYVDFWLIYYEIERDTEINLSLKFITFYALPILSNRYIMLLKPHKAKQVRKPICCIFVSDNN